MDTSARTRRALGLLFAGMLLVLLDFSINRYDLLPDPAGWLLAAIALGELRGFELDDVFRSRVTLAWWLAWIATAVSAVVYVVDLPGAIGFFASLLDDVQPVVTALALLRMAQLNLPDLSRSWRTTVVALVATSVFTHFVVLLAETTQTDDIGALAALAVVVFFVAFVLYLVSIIRTRVSLAS